MNEGVPDCPECGGKGMCDLHKLEYKQHEAIVAMTAYRDELLKQANRTITNLKKTERNQNEKL